jgi:hypothetical protein
VVGGDGTAVGAHYQIVIRQKLQVGANGDLRHPKLLAKPGHRNPAGSYHLFQDPLPSFFQIQITQGTPLTLGVVFASQSLMSAFSLTHIASPVNTAGLNWQAEDAIMPKMIDHIREKERDPNEENHYYLWKRVVVG